VSASKFKLGLEEALKLVAKADNLYVSKGKKVVYVDLKAENPDKETLGKLLLGPTGNLRAPTIRKDKTLLVGFDESTYKKILAGK
jgi:hypothetical protein